MPKEPDELGLQQAELVIVFQQEEGEALTSLLPEMKHQAQNLASLFLQLNLSVLSSMVLWGENARWREGLVSCQLCHRDHQPHCHGEQCAAHEAPA